MKASGGKKGKKGQKRQKGFSTCADGLNPPNGSWGIVKARPTRQAAISLNPPNGSWGIVKIQPSCPGDVPVHGTKGRTLTIPQLPLGGFKGAARCCRLDFNDPPTAVGGIKVIWLTVCFAVALAACTNNQAPQSANRVAQYSAEFEQVISAGRNEAQVVVAFFSPPTPTIQKKILLFEESYGIKVNVATLSAAQFFSRLDAERAANKLSMDVRISGYPDGRQLAKLQIDQPFGSLPEAEAAGVEWIEQFHPLREVRAGRNMVIYRGHGWGMVVNRGLVPPEQAPKTWKDLANPIYRGKIILFDPSISGPGCNLYHFLTDVYGSQWTNEFLQNVAALTRSPFQADKQAARGEFGIHVPSSSGTLVSLWSLPEPRPFYTVVPEDGALMIPSTISLLKDAPHPNAARALTNFLLSKEAQQIEADEPGGGYIRSDVKPRVPELAFHVNAKPFPGTPEKFEWSDDAKHACEPTVNALKAAGINTGQ